ncbi:sensor histidine kinase [Streptomyces sp. AN091965]|uniref:sensor histidine kinase n=1 Tax=Streptomyces sp. AN091965 TaxID=2927803 RepID=UPI001F60364D|nr:sensor histidine kinase [Streptomyces sp. AN091965]MCI3928393.1 sensor histidine kinase [Streptomyces sp. AN091965]
MTRTGFVHQALCYGADEEFLEGTLGYVREGLEAGDALLAVVAGDNIDLLRDALGGAAREVEFIDCLDWYHYPSRTLGQYHAYCTTREQGGARRVRVIGEPVWTGRTTLEVQEWMRYESLLNVAFAESGHWILCPYDTRALPEEVITTARRTHPELAVGDDALLRNDRYAAPADFYAECDEAERELPGSAGREAVEVPFERGRTAVARAAAAEFARGRSLAEGRVQDLVVAVHETVVNAIRFGGGHGVLRLWSEPEYLVCEIADGGCGRLPHVPAFPGHLPPAPRTASGHGLWVVRQLSDLMTERLGPDGSVVRLYFRC